MNGNYYLQGLSSIKTLIAPLTIVVTDNCHIIYQHNFQQRILISKLRLIFGSKIFVKTLKGKLTIFNNLRLVPLINAACAPQTELKH